MKLSHTISHILLLIFFLTAGLSFAEEKQDIVLGPTDLRLIFEDIVFADTSLPLENLQIADFTSRPKNIKVPPGFIEHQLISRSNTKQLGRETIFVAILVNGQEQARVTLRGNLQLYGNVVSTINPKKIGSILSPDDLVTVRRNITMLGPDVVGSPEVAAGKQVKINMRPGAILFHKYLKSPELVRKGDMVSILAQSGALRITVPGRVQVAGAQGDLIRVTNLMSRKEIFATVLSQDAVQVEF